MQPPLESLYVANKLAKSYRSATINKRNQRSKALYSLKHDVLRAVHEDADVITRHIIDGVSHYYFTFQDWGFHLPVSEADRKIETTDSEHLHNFMKETEVVKSEQTEEDALKRLNECGFNANAYLPSHGGAMAQWWFLPPT